MQIQDMIKAMNDQPIIPIDMPIFESINEAHDFLSDVEQAYMINKKWLELLHKANSITKNINTDGLVYDILTEEDYCEMIEYSTYDALHEILRHVSKQCRRLKQLCEDIDGWIIDDKQLQKDYEENGTYQDHLRFFYNNRGDKL